MKDVYNMNMPQKKNRMSVCIRELFESVPSREYITPLFWQHGESHAVLIKEIGKMAAAGVSGFILEARSFPAFLEESW